MTTRSGRTGHSAAYHQVYSYEAQGQGEGEGEGKGDESVRGILGGMKLTPAPCTLLR